MAKNEKVKTRFYITLFFVICLVFLTALILSLPILYMVMGGMLGLPMPSFLEKYGDFEEGIPFSVLTSLWKQYQDSQDLTLFPNIFSD